MHTESSCPQTAQKEPLAWAVHLSPHARQARGLSRRADGHAGRSSSAIGAPSIGTAAVGAAAASSAARASTLPAAGGLQPPPCPLSTLGLSRRLRHRAVGCAAAAAAARPAGEPGQADRRRDGRLSQGWATRAARARPSARGGGKRAKKRRGCGYRRPLRVEEAAHDRQQVGRCLDAELRRESRRRGPPRRDDQWSSCEQRGANEFTRKWGLKVREKGVLAHHGGG